MLSGLLCLPFIGFLFFLLVFLGVALHFGKFTNVRSPYKVIAERASELGFAYEQKFFGESKYVGQYRGRKVAFYLQDLPRGETSLRVVRILAWHRGRIEKEMSVEKPPLIDIDLKRITGLKTNKPTYILDFDGKFRVYGDDGDIRRLVDAAIQAKLLELEPQLLRSEGCAHALTCYNNLIEVYLQSLQFMLPEKDKSTDKDLLLKAIDLVCDVAERAERG